MNNDLTTFTNFLIHIFKNDDYVMREIEPVNPELSPIQLFTFKNYPDQGLTTFVTYGLSEITHPKWHFGRPELLLCVESKEAIWGIALAGIVIQFRGEKSFSHGSTYMMDDPISEESKMEGFVIFKPSFLNSESNLLQMPNKTVYLTQAYPIYPGEAELIKQKGFESFWENEGFQDPYDVRRLNSSNE